MNRITPNERWWLNSFSSPRWWAGVSGLWTVFGTLMAGHVQIRFGGDYSLVDRLGTIVPFYWAWIPLTPPVVLLAARFDFRSGRRLASVGGHVIGGLGAVAGHGLIYSAYGAVVFSNSGGGFVTGALRSIPRHAVGDAATYAVLAGIVLSLQQYRRAETREREAARTALHASRLEAQLSAARLDALQMQLHPHFLFNTLNTIAVLVLKGEGTEAIRAIRQLGDLLRATLRSSGTPERPLHEEVELVRQYLAVEELRFGDRLDVEIDVGTDVSAALVPSLILQPLVENAIVHGLQSKVAAGNIRILAARESGNLRLEVWDNGAGITPSGAGRPDGVGLRNTETRLRELYGESGNLTVGPAPRGGTLARIDLPYHTNCASAGVMPPRELDR